MQAEIITIGDEILIGQITDTNSKWIAERLNDIGVHVYQITSVQDDQEHILKAIEEAEENADIVIMTGGLGPTKDDITKHALAGYFKDTLVMYPDIAEHIKQMFHKMNYAYTDLDIEQAMLPEKATILKNYFGTASGMWFEKNGKVFISLPGVPNEMKGLVANDVLPKLQESFHLPYIIHKTVQTVGVGESRVAQSIEKWENGLPQFIKLAYLPSYGKLRLRLTAKGEQKEILEKSLDIAIEKLHDYIGEIIVGLEEKASIEVSIQKLLLDNKQSLSLAESCTGGNIAKIITSVAGASQIFKGSVVAYSARVKEELLKVSPKTIESHSVVSAEVAREMALNCQKIFRSDYAVATTGNAGPTTDKTDKTVGSVFIAVATPVDIIVEEFNFGQPREKVIQRASLKSLELLRKEILKNTENSL
ncbi:MAG: competence/damage-inducible protein A [Flavobacteriaceae bacterium]|nr:competence/damage-inducible protein A [Flavobacteriaceae bacterium]